MSLLVTGAGLHHQHEVGDFALSLLMYQPDAVGKDGFGVFVFHHFHEIGLQRYDNLKKTLKCWQVKQKTLLTLQL